MAGEEKADIKILNTLFYVEDNVPMIITTLSGLPIDDAKKLGEILANYTEGFSLDTPLTDEGIIPVVTYSWLRRDNGERVADFTIMLNNINLLTMFVNWMNKVVEANKYLTIMVIVDGDRALTLPVQVPLTDQLRDFFSKRAKVFNDIMELAKKKSAEKRE